MDKRRIDLGTCSLIALKKQVSAFFEGSAPPIKKMTTFAGIQEVGNFLMRRTQVRSLSPELQKSSKKMTRKVTQMIDELYNSNGFRVAKDNKSKARIRSNVKSSMIKDLQLMGAMANPKSKKYFVKEIVLKNEDEVKREALKTLRKRQSLSVISGLEVSLGSALEKVNNNENTMFSGINTSRSKWSGINTHISKESGGSKTDRTNTSGKGSVRRRPSGYNIMINDVLKCPSPLTPELNNSRDGWGSPVKLRKRMSVSTDEKLRSLLLSRLKRIESSKSNQGSARGFEGNAGGEIQSVPEVENDESEEEKVQEEGVSSSRRGSPGSGKLNGVFFGKSLTLRRKDSEKKDGANSYDSGKENGEKQQGDAGDEAEYVSMGPEGEISDEDEDQSTEQIIGQDQEDNYIETKVCSKSTILQRRQFQKNQEKKFETFDENPEEVRQKRPRMSLKRPERAPKGWYVDTESPKRRGSMRFIQTPKFSNPVNCMKYSSNADTGGPPFLSETTKSGLQTQKLDRTVNRDRVIFFQNDAKTGHGEDHSNELLEEKPPKSAIVGRNDHNLDTSNFLHKSAKNENFRKSSNILTFNPEVQSDTHHLDRDSEISSVFSGQNNSIAVINKNAYIYKNSLQTSLNSTHNMEDANSTFNEGMDMEDTREKIPNVEFFPKKLFLKKSTQDARNIKINVIRSSFKDGEGESEPSLIDQELDTSRRALDEAKATRQILQFMKVNEPENAAREVDGCPEGHRGSVFSSDMVRKRILENREKKLQRKISRPSLQLDAFRGVKPKLEKRENSPTVYKGGLQAKIESLTENIKKSRKKQKRSIQEYPQSARRADEPKRISQTAQQSKIGDFEIDSSFASNYTQQYIKRIEEFSTDWNRDSQASQKASRTGTSGTALKYGKEMSNRVQEELEKIRKLDLFGRVNLNYFKKKKGSTGLHSHRPSENRHKRRPSNLQEMTKQLKNQKTAHNRRSKSFILPGQKTAQNNAGNENLSVQSRAETQKKGNSSATANNNLSYHRGSKMPSGGQILPSFGERPDEARVLGLNSKNEVDVSSGTGGKAWEGYIGSEAFFEGKSQCSGHSMHRRAKSTFGGGAGYQSARVWGNQGKDDVERPFKNFRRRKKIESIF